MCRHTFEAFSPRVWILRSLTRHCWDVTFALLTIPVSPLRCPFRNLALLHRIVSRYREQGCVIRYLPHEARDLSGCPQNGREQVPRSGILHPPACRIARIAFSRRLDGVFQKHSLTRGHPSGNYFIGQSLALGMSHYRITGGRVSYWKCSHYVVLSEAIMTGYPRED